MLNANRYVFGRKCRITLAIGCAIAGNALIYSGNAAAAEWVFAPYVGLGETYTDNALGTATDRKDDFITTLNAGFSINGVGNRLQLAAEYDLSYDMYARFSDQNGFRHNLLGSANSELVAEHLFLQTEVAFTEETLSSDGNTSFTTGGSTTSDNTRVLTTRISPYYIQDFGGNATGIARYTYSRTDFSSTGNGVSTTEPSDTYTNRIDLGLQSGRDFTRTKWSVDSFALDNQVKNGDDLKRATIKGAGQMPLNRFVALLGTTGWDEFDGENIDNDSISGAFYGGGVRFTPGPKTDLRIQVGHRFGGGIVDADFSYQFSTETRLIAGYHVDVAGSGSSLADAAVLDDNGKLVNPNYFPGGYVDAITKSKTYTMGLAGDYGRNSYSAGASYINREFLDDGTDENVVAINASFARQLSRQLEWSLIGGYSEILDSQIVGQKETAYYGETALNYQFTRDLSGSLSYSYFNRDSESNVEDLRENNISIALRKAF